MADDIYIIVGNTITIKPPKKKTSQNSPKTAKKQPKITITSFNFLFKDIKFIIYRKNFIKEVR